MINMPYSRDTTTVKSARKDCYIYLFRAWGDKVQNIGTPKPTSTIPRSDQKHSWLCCKISTGLYQLRFCYSCFNPFDRTICYMMVLATMPRPVSMDCTFIDIASDISMCHLHQRLNQSIKCYLRKNTKLEIHLNYSQWSCVLFFIWSFNK